MNIGQFAKKPELIKIEIDDADIIEEFGEAITFYMKDYVDITTYFDFFRNQVDGSQGLNDILKKIILNDAGLPAIGDGEALPVNLAVAVLKKVNENLGKLKTKPLMTVTGTQPN